jgi:hypothetical protein
MRRSQCNHIALTVALIVVAGQELASGMFIEVGSWDELLCACVKQDLENICVVDGGVSKPGWPS